MLCVAYIQRFKRHIKKYMATGYDKQVNVQWYIYIYLFVVNFVTGNSDIY